MRIKEAINIWTENFEPPSNHIKGKDGFHHLMRESLLTHQGGETYLLINLIIADHMCICIRNSA